MRVYVVDRLVPVGWQPFSSSCANILSPGSHWSDTTCDKSAMNASLVLPNPVRPSRQCRTSQCLALDTPRRHLTHLQTVGKDVENEKLSLSLSRKIKIVKIGKWPFSLHLGFPGSSRSARPPWLTPGSFLRTIAHLLLAYFRHSKAEWKAPKGNMNGLAYIGSLGTPGSFIQTI